MDERQKSKGGVFLKRGDQPQFVLQKLRTFKFEYPTLISISRNRKEIVEILEADNWKLIGSFVWV